MVLVGRLVLNIRLVSQQDARVSNLAALPTLHLVDTHVIGGTRSRFEDMVMELGGPLSVPGDPDSLTRPDMCCASPGTSIRQRSHTWAPQTSPKSPSILGVIPS